MTRSADSAGFLLFTGTTSATHVLRIANTSSDFSLTGHWFTIDVSDSRSLHCNDRLLFPTWGKHRITSMMRLLLTRRCLHHHQGRYGTGFSYTDPAAPWFKPTNSIKLHNGHPIKKEQTLITNHNACFWTMHIWTIVICTGQKLNGYVIFYLILKN